jgi:hypothetical protein
VQSQSQRRDVSLALIAFIIALVLWQLQGLFFLAFPFRLFVTMIHELGHGMAAVLTGGKFLRFFIIQAGYLGTALFGAALLVITHHIKRPGRVAIGLGVFIAILTLAYTGIRLSNLSIPEMLLAGAILAAGAYMLLTRDMDRGEHRIGLLTLSVISWSWC